MASSNAYTPPSDSPHKGAILSVEIVVASIILLFVSVAFGLLLSTCTRGRRTSSTRDPPPPHPTRASLASRPDRSSSLVGGLDPAVLRSLPVYVYEREDLDDEAVEECTVCLSELVDGEKARLLPGCKHGFHMGCIDMWFHSHSTCPLCRTPVDAQYMDAPSTSTSSGSLHELCGGGGGRGK